MGKARRVPSQHTIPQLEGRARDAQLEEPGVSLAAQHQCLAIGAGMARHWGTTLWGAEKHDLLMNTHRSIYAAKIYTEQYLYFSIINQS